MAQRSAKRTAKTKAGRKAGARPGTFKPGADSRRNTTKPGSGRPPDAIRATLRGSFDERIAILRGFADDPSLDPAVRMKAVDMLGKYGLGTTFSPVDADGNALARFSLTISGDSEGEE